MIKSRKREGRKELCQRECAPQWLMLSCVGSHPWHWRGPCAPKKPSFGRSSLGSFGWVLQLTSFPMLLLIFLAELGVQCVLPVQSTRSCLCATVPQLCRADSPLQALCQQLGGTKGLTIVPAYRLLFQVPDFARNTTGSEQRCRPREQVPILAAGTNASPDSTGGGYGSGSSPVPWTGLRYEEVFV